MVGGQGKGYYRRKAKARLKKKYLALFQLATARIKFTSLRMSTSSLKKETPINDKKTKEEFQEEIKVKLKGVGCKDQKR